MKTKGADSLLVTLLRTNAISWGVLVGVASAGVLATGVPFAATSLRWLFFFQRSNELEMLSDEESDADNDPLPLRRKFPMRVFLFGENSTSSGMSMLLV